MTETLTPEVNWKSTEENQLVKAAQTGQVEAFSELVRRHQPTCLRIARSMLHQPEQAEDETQNAFYKAFLHLHQFRQGSKFSTWLTRIVINQCLMHQRRVRQVNLLSLDAESEDGQAPIQVLRHQSKTPEQWALHAELTRWLEREIRLVSPALRSALLLHDVQQLSLPLVAEKLGITVSAAKSRIYRARIIVKDCLQRRTRAARCF